MELIVAAVLVGAFVVFVLPAIIGFVGFVVSAIITILTTVGALLIIGACVITFALTIVSLLGGG